MNQGDLGLSTRADLELFLHMITAAMTVLYRPLAVPLQVLSGAEQQIGYVAVIMRFAYRAKQGVFLTPDEYLPFADAMERALNAADIADDLVGKLIKSSAALTPVILTLRQVVLTYRNDPARSQEQSLATALANVGTTLLATLSLVRAERMKNNREQFEPAPDDVRAYFSYRLSGVLTSQPDLSDVHQLFSELQLAPSEPGWNGILDSAVINQSSPDIRARFLEALGHGVDGLSTKFMGKARVVDAMNAVLDEAYDNLPATTSVALASSLYNSHGYRFMQRPDVVRLNYDGRIVTGRERLLLLANDILNPKHDYPAIARLAATTQILAGACHACTFQMSRFVPAPIVAEMSILVADVLIKALNDSDPKVVLAAINLIASEPNFMGAITHLTNWLAAPEQRRVRDTVVNVHRSAEIAPRRLPAHDIRDEVVSAAQRAMDHINGKFPGLPPYSHKRSRESSRPSGR